MDNGPTDFTRDRREEPPELREPGTRRVEFTITSGQKISALVWGHAAPQAVFLHGRGQNAHTWNSVARALARPLIAIDLPGHGYSDWREDHDYSPWTNAEAIGEVLQALAPQAEVVVGMSLGGTTAIRLAAKFGEYVQRVVIIDTTPATREGRPPLTVEQRGAVALLEGPSEFVSFDAMLQAVALTVPHRPLDSLRRGVLRNARQSDGGAWSWRYDRSRSTGPGSSHDRSALWTDLAAVRGPVMLVRGEHSGRVLDEDVREFLLRQPHTRVELVENAGHSVQSDQPLVLAGLISDFGQVGYR